MNYADVAVENGTALLRGKLEEESAEELLIKRRMLHQRRCQECDFSTDRISSLKAHMKLVHRKLKLHQCTECNFNASKCILLRRHLKLVHKKFKQHQCPKCSYSTPKVIYTFQFTYNKFVYYRSNSNYCNSS